MIMQRVKFWLTDTSTHEVTMELEEVVGILDWFKSEELGLLRVVLAEGTILHFNPANIACIQVDNMEEVNE